MSRTPGRHERAFSPSARNANTASGGAGIVTVWVAAGMPITSWRTGWRAPDPGAGAEARIVDRGSLPRAVTVTGGSPVARCVPSQGTGDPRSERGSDAGAQGRLRPG